MCSVGERCPPFRRGPACQSARKTPGRLAPAGREAGHADASPVTLPAGDWFCFWCFFRKYRLQR
ncbi:TPA: hypothetical protein HF523_19650 [Escherichia coli]|nr:hypothetical protein [Escherichia coli]